MPYRRGGTARRTRPLATRESAGPHAPRALARRRHRHRLAGGFTFSRNLRAGAELNAWRDETAGVTQRLVLYGASLYWMPTPAASWHLKGGIGLLNYRASTEDDDEDPLEASNPALQLGVGYDVRTGSKVWLTPFANLIVSTSGNLTSGSSIVTDASFSLMQIGAAVTWR